MVSSKFAMLSFLLLTNAAGETAFARKLARALEGFGRLDVLGEDAHLLLGYDAILVDASSMADVQALIERLRRESPEVKIVYVTASPTWQRVREAFRSGADDYLVKSWSEQEMDDFFHKLFPRS